MMKILCVALILTGLFLLCHVGLSVAFAENKTAPTSPTKLTREDMLDFENAELKLRELQRQADEIISHRNTVLAKYQIKYEDIGKQVGWGSDGTIQRAPKPTPAAAPKLPPPPKK